SQALLRGLGEDPADPAGAIAQVRAVDPRLAVMFEPMLGVTFTPTRISASEKINVIPARAELRVDCRVPPGLGEEDVRARVEEVLGSDGYSLEFDEEVIGNRSPIETPLMGHIRDFLGREDPGAAIAPTVLPGFT